MLPLLLLCMAATAQIQYGYVRSQGTSYNRSGTRLPGVKVFVKGLNGAKVTGANGSFNFNLGGGKTVFSISNVLLPGYTLLSPLAPAYNVGKAPVEIVLQSRAEKQQNEARMAKEIEKRITNNYNARTRELQRKIAALEAALTDKTRNTDDLERQICTLKGQLGKLDDQYLKRNELIDKMVEEYVNLDYAKMDDRKAELCSYIESGELEKADSLLNTIDINKEMSDIKTLRSDIEEKESMLSKEKEACKSKIETVSMYWRGKYDIAIQSMQYDSAAIYVKNLADVDTCNLENVFECAQFFQKQYNYDVAEGYYKLLLRQMEDVGVTKNRLQVLTYHNLSLLYNGKKDRGSAIGCSVQAMNLCSNLKDDWLAIVVINGVMILGANIPDFFNEELVEETYVLFLQRCLMKIFSDDFDNNEEAQNIRTLLQRMISSIEDGNDLWKPVLVELYENLLGEANSEEALCYSESMSALAQLAISIKDFEFAEELYELGDKFLSKCSAEHEQEKALLSLNVALLHAQIGKMEFAEKEYIQALSVYKKLIEENAIAYGYNYLVALRNLAALHGSLGKNELAEKEYLEAIEIQKQLAEKTPQVYYQGLVDLYNNLAILYYANHRVKECEEVYLSAISILGRLAADYPKADASVLATSYKNLANLYYATHRFVESEEMYHAAMVIFERLAGDDTQIYQKQLAEIYHWFGRSKESNNKYSEAIIQFERSLKFCKDIMKDETDESMYYYMYMDNLSRLYSLYGNDKCYEMAYAYNAELLLALQTKYEEDKDRWRISYNEALINHSFCANLLGKFKEGEQLSLKALKVDSTVHFAYANFAAALLFQGKVKEAEKVYSEYKGEFKDEMLSDFAEFERLEIIPEERKAEVDRIKAMLKE